MDIGYQIKPLTEEEKKAKLAELRERMAEKRARKAEQDAQEHKANEILRRKAAKVCVVSLALLASTVERLFFGIGHRIWVRSKKICSSSRLCGMPN